MVTVHVPADVEVLDCENLFILEIPDSLRVPGYVMLLFGAQNMALYHLSPSTSKTEDYRLLGTQMLITERDHIPNSKISVVKLVPYVQGQTEFTFMMGWSKAARLEQL